MGWQGEGLAPPPSPRDALGVGEEARRARGSGGRAPQNISDIPVLAWLRIVLDSPVSCSGTGAGMPPATTGATASSVVTLPVAGSAATACGGGGRRHGLWGGYEVVDT